MTRPLPYGSWPSPVSAQSLTRAAIKLGPGLIDHHSEYWAEGHPDQGGRIGLWRRDPGGTITELTPEHYVRTGVNEYGGGAWTVADGLVAYCSWPDGEVHLIDGRGDRVIAVGGQFRYAGLSLYPDAGLLLAVREDHGVVGDPQQSVVALDLDGNGPEAGRVLVSGADFYAHPSLSDDGRLAWCEWDLPDMPWDCARIFVAPLSNLAAPIAVAADPEVSALYPAWASDGALIYLSDASGFWNFHRWQHGLATRLAEMPFDFCYPLWVLDPVPYTVIDAQHLGCTWVGNGFDRIGVLSFNPDSSDAQLAELATDAITIQVTGRGSSILARFGYPDRPAALVAFDWDTAHAEARRVESPATTVGTAVAVAQPFDWLGEFGQVHGWYYPPTNPEFTGMAEELPPVQVWSHGGPTGFARPEFNPAVQFWTSRGIGILDVNYSGSAGYGRAYRDRLNGLWGIADVSDCVSGVQALAAAGFADGKRLSIRGGSAGGFTTLAALTFSDVFSAGISLYGIGDLEMLATDTHKFEARYLDRLVAPYPAGIGVYRDRSPIHHLDQLSCPMLILQGADDKVVPPAQAEAMAAAMAANGLAATLRIFPGEGHGFRKAETIIAVAEEALAFLGTVHGFTPGE